MFTDSGRGERREDWAPCAIVGAAVPTATLAVFRNSLRSIKDTSRKLFAFSEAGDKAEILEEFRPRRKLNHGAHFLANHKRGDDWQVHIAIPGNLGSEYRSGDKCRRQISTGRPRGIHQQVYVFAHQAQRKLRRVATILNLPEISGQMFCRENCLGDCLHVIPSRQIHLNT